jgi:hypothetical protein
MSDKESLSDPDLIAGRNSGNRKRRGDEREVEANRHDLGRGRDGVLGCRPTLPMDRWAAPATRAGDSVGLSTG